MHMCCGDYIQFDFVLSALLLEHHCPPPHGHTHTHTAGCGYLDCVFVCLCVWETERERVSPRFPAARSLTQHLISWGEIRILKLSHEIFSLFFPCNKLGILFLRPLTSAQPGPSFMGSLAVFWLIMLKVVSSLFSSSYHLPDRLGFLRAAVLTNILPLAHWPSLMVFSHWGSPDRTSWGKSLWRCKTQAEECNLLHRHQWNHPDIADSSPHNWISSD